MAYTLNQIVSKLKAIGENHPQIGSVWYGNIAVAIAEKDRKYPLMSFSIATSPTSSNKEQFPVEFFIVDRLNLDKPSEHEIEIHSDCLAICTDIIALLRDQSAYDWDFDGNTTRDLFAADANTPDATAGVMMTLTLTQPLRDSRCVIPSA